MTTKYVSGTFAANGSSSQVNVIKNGIAFIGAAGFATFGSGTVTVQMMGADGLWYSSQTTATSSDVLKIDVALPTAVRLTLTWATAPSIGYVLQSDSPVIVQ